MPYPAGLELFEWDPTGCVCGRGSAPGAVCHLALFPAPGTLPGTVGNEVPNEKDGGSLRLHSVAVNRGRIHGANHLMAM